MNLKDILNKYQVVLGNIYDEQEILAIFLLVAQSISGLSRSQIAVCWEESVTSKNVEEYSLILERLSKEEPLQYILAEAYFYGLRLNVNSAVLIPRPETEELVELAINTLKNRSTVFKILDIGTGSGCIAIALKHNLANADVYALDVSLEALEIAGQNANRHHAEISFIEEDIRKYKSNEKFDVIISNPPYITDKEGALMNKNVMDYEPHLALFVSDESPLEFYEAIASFAMQNLNNDGLLFFEINANYGKETASMLANTFYTDVEIFKDMQGKDRFITARKSG